MNRLSRVILSVLVALVMATSYAGAKIVDEAGLFSAGVVSQLDQRIAAINRAYGRDVLVVTVKSLNGQSIPQVAQRYINVPIQQVSGVFIFISIDPKKIDLAVGRNTTSAISPNKKEEIRLGLVSAFRSNSFDQGILTAVGAIDDDLRLAGTANAPVAPAAPHQQPQRAEQPVSSEPRRSSGGGIGIFGFLIIALGVWIVFSIIRGLARGTTGGGGGTPTYGSGGGYGGSGYGGGYGGGGGGGFLSNFLGGVGGAMAGNWLYDRFSNRHDSDSDYGHHHDSSAFMSGSGDSGGGGAWSNDAGTGWSSDGGASWGGSDSGSWGGDSGGSWGGDSGGFGDSGGGFGDSGGGGDWS